ncbi:uncharacterized protein EDB93DRAFT_1101423 [Suillus bovinus]|uniref:uncharacterized protein n=1 Tax=Suillus bovinus TaxID=48563 RepID=UPI001B86C010|nr:uncharacterized protein EDB93DRAFT_1101423 [Suillus bovinus]KAG2156529.1 hypothetical protein EDB93DRAFT_1101423 [Suillus bovinus]
MRLQEDRERQKARAGSHTAPITHEPAYNEYVRPDEGSFMLHKETPENERVLPPTFQPNDIKTKYHPRSGIAMKIDHIADFHHHAATCSQVPENLIPWEPFSSRIDFNFVELVLKTNLTKVQTNELISLICHTAFEQFSVTDYNSICKMWDAASPRHAKFKKEVILVSHRDQEYTFDVWHRPLWDWACDLLKDHRLGPHFVFDAQRLYKYDGQDFVHFFDEPWTTNAFWDSQSSLLKDEGKPFTFIIYADKAKLSSFGCQKAYPVIVRCANLPVGIRNGEGFGGGRLVEEDRQYSGTQSWVNFKNVVWHESFKCLLKSLAPLSKTGFWVKCWDGVESDYEEQFLTAVLQMCHDLDTQNKLQVPLSYIAHTDVYSAVSFDRLHVNNEGNFSDHLWTQFQEHIKLVGQQAQAKIDEHFDLMPHWQNLNHFNHIMDISFSDGSKYEDISKIIVFAAHDVINRASESHELPYLLLCCMREYVYVDMYAALEVHTSKTIVAGHQAVKEFTQLLDQYSEKDDSGKNWAHPKRHAHTHLFDDIEAKGATHNTNTKPNEKCHGPIRQTYLWCTNFKNIAEQKADSRWAQQKLYYLDNKYLEYDGEQMVIFHNATKNYENILGDPQSREMAPNYWMMIATGHYRVFKHKVLWTCNNAVQMSENMHGNNYAPSEASLDGQDTGWTSSEDNEDDLNSDPDNTVHIKLGAAQNEQTFEDLERLHANDNVLSELYSLLPSHIHPLVVDHHFTDGKLLGISVSQRTLKPFPPVLFPNLVEDASLKTIFGNWQVFGKIIHIVPWGGPPCNGNKWEITSLTPGLLAWAAVVVIFLLSADKEFHYSGKGETTRIQYSYMFSLYKKIIIKNWNTEYTRDIMKELNSFIFTKGSRMVDSMSDEEDFTAVMDHALAGITEGEENAVIHELIQDMMDETVADDEHSGGRSRANSALTEPEDKVITNVAPRHVRGHQRGRGNQCSVSSTTRTTCNTGT